MRASYGVFIVSLYKKIGRLNMTQLSALWKTQEIKKNHTNSSVVHG